MIKSSIFSALKTTKIALKAPVVMKTSMMKTPVMTTSITPLKFILMNTCIIQQSQNSFRIKLWCAEISLQFFVLINTFMLCKFYQCKYKFFRIQLLDFVFDRVVFEFFSNACYSWKNLSIHQMVLLYPGSLDSLQFVYNKELIPSFHIVWLDPYFSLVKCCESIFPCWP